VTFRDHVGVLREHWLLVVLGLVLGLGGGAAFGFLSTPQYASSVTFFVSTPAASGTDAAQAYEGSLLSAQKIKSYTELATGPRLRERVSDELRSYVAPGVISASARPDTVLLTLTAADRSPQRAQSIAAFAARDFAELVAEVEKPAKGDPTVIARTVQSPQLPTAPISPDPVRDLLLGALLGLLAGIAMAMARHALDRSVKSAGALAQIVNAPVLGTTAYDPAVRSRPLIVHDQPRAPLAEAFRQVRTNLQYVDLDHSKKLIVITSPLPEEGKTTTACNLAIVLAKVGRKVLLVEADLRRPRAGEYLGLEDAVGLTNILTGTATLDEVLQPWSDGLFDFLGAGPLPPNPSELLASKQMKWLLADMHNRYDVVLLDTPPTLPVTDAAVLAAQCHGALLVVRHGRATTEQAKASAETLHKVSATLLGAVMTMTPRSRRHSGYAYAYEYGSGAVPAESLGPVRPERTRKWLRARLPQSLARLGPGRRAVPLAESAVPAPLPEPAVSSSVL
jgi:tyrosine-protein kinase